MALIKLGGGVTDMRGSIGGTTFSRGAGGNIARSNKKPCTRHTATQTAARARLSRLTERWTSTLTQTQRDNWIAYAQGTTWTNRLAESIVIGGLAAYLRLNATRLLVGLAISDAAPTALGHAAEPAFTFTASVATQKVTIPVEPTGWDKDEPLTYLLIYLSHTMPAGRLAVPPLVYGTSLVGSAGSPVAFPWTSDWPYSFVLDNRITIAGVHLDADNRLSSPYYVQAQAAA